MRNPLSYVFNDLNDLSIEYKKLVLKIYIVVLRLILTVAFPHLVKGLYYLIRKKKKEQYKEFTAGSHIWGKEILKITESKLEFQNTIEIPESGHIIMLNHINEIDFPFDCIVVSKPFLANQTIKSSVFAYWWMSAMGSQVFDTSHQRTIANSIRNLMEGLKERSFIVYPEGGNSYSEEMRSFKKGMIKLAFDQKVPVALIIKSGVTKFQKTQKNVVITYKSCGIIQPSEYPNWESFRDSIYNTMVTNKRILDESLIDKNKDLHGNEKDI